MLNNNQQQQAVQSLYKMDRLFYNSVIRTKYSYYNKIGFNFTKTILLIIFIILQYQVFAGKQILQNLSFFSIAISLIYVIANIIFVRTFYSNTPQNNKTFLNIAVIAGHFAFQQPITNRQDLYQLQQCTSANLYNQINGSQIDDPTLTTEIKNKYEIINSNLIQTQIVRRHSCFAVFDTFLRFIFFNVLIFGVIALIKSSPTIPEVIIFVIYLILESMNVWLALAIIFIIAFSPLICCCLCCYICFYGTSALIVRDSLDIPASNLATAQIIENAEGSCTICLQNFHLNDQVIVLPCSTKHVFHENCILSWLRVSNSCPNCRAALPNRI